MRVIAPIIRQYALGQPGGRIWALWLEAPELASLARPGQFIMLKKPDSSSILGRPFSIAAVTATSLCIIYQEAGKVTAQLPKLEPDTELLLWGPLGQGFNFQARPGLLIGGGVGLAPMIFAWQQQAMRPALLLGFDQWRRFEHLPGLLREMNCPAAIRHIGPAHKIEPGQVYITSQQPSAHWRAECALALDPLTPENLQPFAEIYACGPWPMLKRLAALALAAGKPCQVAGEAIMACGVGACQGCALPRTGGGYLNLCQTGPVLNSLVLDWERI